MKISGQNRIMSNLLSIMGTSLVASEHTETEVLELEHLHTCMHACITAKKKKIFQPDWVTSVAYGICPPTITFCTNRKHGHCPSMYIM